MVIDRVVHHQAAADLDAVEVAVHQVAAGFAAGDVDAEAGLLTKHLVASDQDVGGGINAPGDVVVRPVAADGDPIRARPPL